MSQEKKEKIIGVILSLLIIWWGAVVFIPEGDEKDDEEVTIEKFFGVVIMGFGVMAFLGGFVKKQEKKSNISQEEAGGLDEEYYQMLEQVKSHVAEAQQMLDEWKDDIEKEKKEKKEKNMDWLNFIALDIETATDERSSICEIGLTFVEKGNVLGSKSWLIQPPGNKYYPFNIEIHGITPEDTADKPNFHDVWAEINPYIEGKVVVAHNTAFDMYALRDAFIQNDMPYPQFAFYCSYRSATKVFKEPYSYSLPVLCDYLGIELDKHHRAGSDSKACAEIFIKTVKFAGVESFKEFGDKLNLNPGYFMLNEFKPALSKKHKKKIDVNSIVGDPSKLDEGSYFYDKVVCFTGTCMYGTRKELLQKIADIGGIPVNSVTKSTDILVVGQQDYRVVGEEGMSTKQKKAMKIKDEGGEIEIMSEKEFLQMI